MTNIDPGWRELNHFQATTPIIITQDEDGNLLARGALTPGPHLQESDEDLVVIDD